jgi:hypothetical protein
MRCCAQLIAGLLCLSCSRAHPTFDPSPTPAPTLALAPSPTRTPAFALARPLVPAPSVAPLATPSPRPTHAPSSWTTATVMINPPVKHPRGVADVVAHVPDGFDPRERLNLILFFHASDQCVAQLALGGDVICTPRSKPTVGAGVAWRHDDAGTMSLFAAPQLMLWDGGTAGRFVERDYFPMFLDELLESTFAPGLGGPRTTDDLASVTLVAHSAGYRNVFEIIRRDDWDDKVQNVVLLDALFDGGVEVLSAWVERGLAKGLPRKLIAVHGPWGANVENGRAIAERVEEAAPGSTIVDPPGALADAARSHVVTVKQWPHVEHSWMLLLLMSKAIAGLGLPPRTVWPPATFVGVAEGEPELIEVGDTKRETIDTGDRRLRNGALADEFSIDLDEGQKVTIEARGSDSFTEPCCLLDVVMQVSQGDRVLAEDDDSGGDFDSRIEFVAPEHGRYVVRVSTYGSGERRGPYVLRVF